MGGFAAAWVGFSFALPHWSAHAGRPWCSPRLRRAGLDRHPGLFPRALQRQRGSLDHPVQLRGRPAHLLSHDQPLQAPGRLVGNAADPAVGLSAGDLQLLAAQLGAGHRPACLPSPCISSSAHGARLCGRRDGRRRRNSPNMAASTSSGRGFFVLLRLGRGRRACRRHRSARRAPPLHGGFCAGLRLRRRDRRAAGQWQPIGTIVTALFFGALRNGSLLLEVDTTASREIITVIQALIILSRLGAGH